MVGRFERAFRLTHSPLQPLSPSPQINEGEKLQCSDSFVLLLLSVIGNARERNVIHHVMKGKYRKYSPAAMKCSCLHSRTGRLSNRAQHHHPRDLRPTVLRSNFVSPILGIKGEHERSDATNHCMPSASATYSGLPWGESLSLFLSLFKMGAELVTYHKGVFS